MRVCVIDGRGGGLGTRLVTGLQLELGQGHHIVALGTNTAAAAAMKQAGAAILGARATKVLLPLNRARVEIVGEKPCTLEMLITQSLSRVRSLVSSVGSV